MKKFLFLVLFLPLPAIAAEPVSIETARTKSIALAEVITTAHDQFKELHTNGDLDNADVLLPVLKPLVEAVQSYDRLRKEDEQLSAVNGLGFTTHFQAYGECSSGGNLLSGVIESFGKPDSDQSVKFRASMYRFFLASMLTCQVTTGQMTIPAKVRTAEGLNREILRVLDKAMSGLLEYGVLMTFENDTSAAKTPGELDWMFHVDIAGPAQVVGVYVGLAMKEQYWSLKSYPVCFAALNSFMNILDEVNKNVSAGQGAMNNLSQLEKSYLRERKLCEEELH